jgi:hypothetical protein
MRVSSLTNWLMKKEGLKKQVNRAQMQEIVGCLAEHVYTYPLQWADTPGDLTQTLFDLGYDRVEKRSKKKGKKRGAVQK